MFKRLIRALPAPLKDWLRPLYLLLNKQVTEHRAVTYEDRVAHEKEHFFETYKDRADDESLFSHTPTSWSFVETAAQNHIREQIGMSQWEYLVARANQISAPAIASLGCGPCGIEMFLAEQITSDYHFHCIDLNDQILEIGRRRSEKKGLRLSFQTMDLNAIVLDANRYDLVMAFSALHHLDELEKVYAAINQSLKPDGIFVTVDVITRNGLMLWPETYALVKHLWAILPRKYKFDHVSHARPTFVPEFQNIDYGAISFEAIRSQDVLPLLPDFFDPIIYVPYHSICRHFLDDRFGPNYDMNNPIDVKMAEFIWELDRYYLRERTLPPEAMFAVMRKKGAADPAVVAEISQRMRADARGRRAH